MFVRIVSAATIVSDKNIIFQDVISLLTIVVQEIYFLRYN